MKIFLSILLGFIVLVGLGIGSVFFFTADMVDEADSFFATVRAGEQDEAYEKLSSAFKQATSKEQLGQFLGTFGLQEVTGSSWSSRSINGGEGSIEGTVTTASGSEIPLKVSFVKEDGEWKILGIRKPASGIQSDEAQQTVAHQNPGIPPKETQVALVQEAMKRFGESIKEKSMEKFHGYISALWRSQHDVAKLNEAYKGLFTLPGDLEKISNLIPVFGGPAKIDERGVLYLAGHFPTEPSRVIFEQSYVHEATGWKLLGFNINIVGDKG